MNEYYTGNLKDVECVVRRKCHSVCPVAGMMGQDVDRRCRVTEVTGGIRRNCAVRKMAVGLWMCGIPHHHAE